MKWLLRCMLCYSVPFNCFRHSTRFSESHGKVSQQIKEKDQLCRQLKGKIYSCIIKLIFLEEEEVFLRVGVGWGLMK